MDLRFTAEELAFRDEVREFLRTALPDDIRRKIVEGRHLGKEDIVTIGSQLAQSSPGKNAAYIASKGAIASFTKTIAVDHASQGIRVNALMPGVIDTPMPARSLKRYADPEAMKTFWKHRHPMGRIGKPEEVARAALFLACDDSSFVTGTLLFVDGGWTAH